MDDSKTMSFISTAEAAIESVNDLECMRAIAKEILKALKSNNECYKKAIDLLEQQHQIIERYDKLTNNIIADIIK